MSDFLVNTLMFGAVYLFSLLGISYARIKPKKIQIAIIAIVTIAFSLYMATIMQIGINRIPIDTIEKEWKRYTTHCEENHISWSEYTFSEWLGVEASQ